MEQKTLFKHKNVKIGLTRGAEPDVIELLHGSLWGSPGGTLYQHVNSDKKIAGLRDTLFLTLRKTDRLIGTIALCHRVTEDRGQKLDAWFLRYFSFGTGYRTGKQAGVQTRLHIHRASSAGRSGFINNSVETFFREVFPGLNAEKGITKYAVYAYVERENERSGDLYRRFGFSRMASFSTVLFSRFFPRLSPRVSLLAPDSLAHMRELLAEQYAGHGLFPLESVLSGKDYFIIKEDGKITAGVKAVPVTWRIMNIPGWSGKIILNVVPHVPMFSKLFNPGNFQFASVEGVYCRKGRESELLLLLESVCAGCQLHTAMMWLDSSSGLHRGITSRGKLGLLQKINSDIPVDVILKTFNFTTEEEERLISLHSYPSAYDIT